MDTRDVTGARGYRVGVHPIHAALLAGTVPLFLGAMLSDIAYASSYEVQWINFASWLIVGGLVFAGIVLLWALVDLIRANHRTGRALAYLLLVLAIFGLGFINALLHARDAWASMPIGLVFSAIIALLACVATGAGFARPRTGDAR